MLLASQTISDQHLPLRGALETFIRLGVAVHEAFLSCWTHKYASDLLRPVTYVRRYLDPDFTTFVNSPQFPEYTSGHSVASAAAAQEAATSRLYGGVHYPMGIDNGLVHGEAVGRVRLDRLHTRR